MFARGQAVDSIRCPQLDHRQRHCVVDYKVFGEWDPHGVPSGRGGKAPRGGARLQARRARMGGQRPSNQGTITPLGGT